MTNEELLQAIKERSAEFSNEQLLQLAELADLAYKRNFCQLYTQEDFIEEFVDTFLQSLKNLPPEVEQALKEKILNL